MARVTLWVPDALYRRAQSELGAEVNWSALFREGLAAELDGPCDHDDLRCQRCGARLVVAPLPRDA